MGGFKSKVSCRWLAVGRNADDAVIEEDLGTADYQGHPLFSEVGHEVRDALKHMILRLHLKPRNETLYNDLNTMYGKTILKNARFSGKGRQLLIIIIVFC